MADLESHTGAIVGLSSDLRLSYVNPAWFRFARENGGEPRISREWALGRSIVESWISPYRDFYETRYRASLRTRRVWTHEYECSSPETRRFFHQIVYPVDDAMLVVHSPSVALADGERDPVGQAADPARYLDADGLISQCMYCRRVRLPGAAERWDWIEAWATQFPRCTSHGLCATCFRFYYPVCGEPDER